TLSDVWKCEGDSVSWTVNYSAVKKPSLLWQRSTNGGTTWTDLNSDTLNTLKLKNVVFAMNKYRYRMLASNFCESIKPSSAAVLNVRAPLRLLLPPDTTICYGAAIDLIANGTGGDSTRYIFNWTGFPAGNKIQVKPTAKKVYYVNLDDQCTNYDVQDSVVVLVRMPLSLKLNNDTTLCNGRPVKLSAAVSGGRSNTYQYLWTPGKLTTASITVAPTDTTRYRVRVTDGCTPDSAVGTVLVRVLKPLDLALTRDTILCQGRGIFLNATPAGGRLSSRNVRWNLGLGTGWTKWIQPTSTTTYTAILSDGCSVKEDTAKITVQMRSPLALTLNKDTTICAGTKANLYTKSGGGLNSAYLIRWNQGLSNGTNHLVQPSTTTTYRAVLSDGCTVKNDTQQVTVTVRPLLDVRLGNDTTLCFGNGFTMNVTSFGGTGLYSYRWEDKANPAVSLGSGSSLTATPLTTVTYRVILSDGCSAKNDTDELKVTVLPNLKLSTSPDTSICFGNNALLRSSVSGGKGSYTYTWTDLSNSQNMGSNAQLSVSPGSSRKYRIAVNDGCTANPPSAEVQIRVEALPGAAFILSDTTACAPAILQLRNNSVGVRFTINGRRYSGADTTIRPNVGLTNVQLRAFNVLGCPDSFSKVVEVYPKPQAGFSYMPADPRELDIITFTDASIGADAYAWDLPHGSFFTPAVPGWSSKDTGSWLLRQIVRTNKGCSDTFSTWLRVGVGYFLQIPTAFTPNGDGLNDIWKPLTRGARNYELKIFNRWGQMVFTTNKQDQGWDGLNALEGVYVYTLSFVNGYDKRISEKGVITLMR
ncbi:MAG: gliding motility-associated C-terminal domain-containing protein, partial [Bacteroidetes bacterium]|nr:gliding motility-associated C-terminal domain-containing protein [Bacteroidota bacterium]